MKPPARQDYAGSEHTDPGAGDDGGVADDVEDEFPNDATRIDDSFLTGGVAAGAKGAAKATPKPAAVPARPAQAPAKPTRPAPKAKDPAKDKLAALQSLSLDGGGKSPPQQARKQQPQRSSGGGGKLPWVLLFLVGAGLGGNWAYQKYGKRLGLGGGSNSGNDKPQPTVRIETVTPSGGSGQVHMAAGYVAARTPIAISAPSGGVIKDVKVSNGDKIKRGQLLIQLDDSAARADLVAAGAEVTSAEAQYRTKQKLKDIGAATPIDVLTAHGAVEVARAKLAPIRQRISQAKIYAPIDGTVLERLSQPGETISGSTPVMRVADLTHLVAETDIVEADIVKIRREQAVKVTSDAALDRTYDGKVAEIAQQADKARGTVLVKVALDVPDLSIKPGMSVKCAFQPDASAKARIYVSRSAINPQAGVWLVGADNHVSHHPVTVSPTANGTSAEITAGLVGGERILSDATQGREGMSVLP